jgi:hypothetical protein
MAEDQSAFKDVLSLCIDTDAFAADLSSIEKMWNESLGRMSESAKKAGIDPSQIISTQGLQDTLAELGAQVDGLSSQVKEDFTLMGNAVVKELSQIDSAVARTEENLTKLKETQAGAGGGFAPTKRGGKRASMFGVDPEAGVVSNFMSGLTMGGQGAAGIAAMAGYLTTMATVGTALYAVINGITELFMAIPHALMDGITYMEKFQQEASDLQGVMASNLKFSSDFATNFKMAGESAQYAVSHLRDNAAAANLDPKQLENSFKSIVDSGGGAMTKDVDQLVQLTTEFALAMKAAGKSSEGTRALVSEIPKLLEGTEAPSSKLLQTLNLTKVQWEAIRQEALEHKNLLELLAPAFAPYNAQVKTAQDNQEVLEKQLGRQKEKIESAFAAPVVKEFSEIIKGTLDYINSNKNSIELLANAAGQLVAEILKLGPALTAAGGEGHPVLAFLAEGFAQVTLIVETFRGTLATTAEAARQLWNVLKTPLGGNVKAAMESASAAVKASQEKQSAELEAERQRLALMVESVDADRFASKATDAESGGKNNAFSGGRVPLPTDKSKDAIAKMREEWSHGLEEIKSKYGELLDSQKQMEAESTETVHAGTEHRMALRRGELVEAQQLLDQMRAKYGSIKGAPDKLSGMGDTVDKLKADAKKQGTADSTEDFKTTVSIDQMKYQTQQKMAEEHYSIMNMLFKRSAQEGLMSYEDAAKAEIALQISLYNEARAAIVKQRDASGAVPGTKEYQGYTDKLSVLDSSQAGQRSQDSHTLATGSLKDSSEKHENDTALINAQIAYASTVKDGAEKQQQLNALLAQRLKADQEYLAAVNANASSTMEQKRAAQSNVTQDQQAQLSEYNSSHVFQKQLDSSGTMQSAGFFDDLKQGSDKVSQAFALLEQTTQKLLQAQGNRYEQIGAVAGGISGVAQQGGDVLSKMGGMMGSIGSALPGIGAAVGAVGSIIGMIGGMFAKQAKNIADDIQKKFDGILQNFQNNTATFAQTMAALQQEQQLAISQLSGVKGGEGYLSQILLQVKQTEDALNAQALAGRDQMGILAATMTQSTQVGQQWMQTWATIEQQVKQYIDKDGGNTALATRYQDVELADQARKLQDQYNQGLQQAVQDNYTLNGLMLSRQSIQLSILQLENQMSDSIERRQAPAMGLAAQQTKLQLEQLKQQLSDTDNQISIEQNKVSQENALFGLTTDINALHKEDAALQAYSLNEQLANYKEMYAIIQAISGLQANPNTGYFNGTSPFNPAQLPGGLPGFGATGSSTPPPSSIVINGPIHVNLPGMKGGSDVARGIANELDNWRRFGVTL